MTINWPATTDVFLLSIVVICLIYEAIVVSATKDADSISWEVWTASQRRPIIAFAAGLLCGHLFGQFAS
jgi:hypothetical protein